MNSAVQFDRIPPLDEPWRRLPWLIPVAIVAWAALLFAFSLVLEQTPPPAAPENAVEARIIEIPVGGLAGGGGGGSAAAPAAPRVAPRSRPKPVHHKKVIKAAPPVPVSPEGTLKSKPETAPAPPGAEPATGSASSGAAGTVSGSSAEGGGAGPGGAGPGGAMGSNTLGARAIYAPTPEIPDDLRQEVFQAVAVAHFKVGYDGTVTVTLTTPTPNPRLNQLLLDDLKQWRFFPGMKDGVAIDSEFDVRIPIRVQ